MAHSSLIFKYSKYYPTKQHFITHSPTQNQKIQNPFFCFSFYSLLVYYVHATAHSTSSSSPQTKQNKTLSSAQLSHPLKLSPHDPKKKTNHYFLSSYFLKINHSEQGCSQRVSFQFLLHLFLVCVCVCVCFFFPLLSTLKYSYALLFFIDFQRNIWLKAWAQGGCL